MSVHNFRSEYLIKRNYAKLNTASVNIPIAKKYDF